MLFIAAIAFTSCKDFNTTKPTTATVTVINAITDVPNVKMNITGKAISWKNITQQVAYGAREFYYTTTGLISLHVVSALDTTKVLFNNTVNLQSKVYTMYLTGTAVQSDTIFREEINYPFIRTDQVKVPSEDSVVNVRFVNLSVGSPALKVKLSTVTTNEVDNLPYKGITAFKAYPARLTSTAYSFQVRRVDTDALVTTFNFSATSANKFRNVALVISGVFGTTTGTAPFGISVVNYF